MSFSNQPLHIGLDVTAVPTQPVGAGRYTIEIARALGRRNDLVTTLFARQADAPRWKSLAGEADKSLNVVARAPRSRPLRLLYGELGLSRDVRAKRPALDLFHGPHYQTPRALHRPCVVTVHDLTFVEHPEWHERSKVIVFSRALRLSAQRADVVICVSQHTADRYMERYRPRGEVRVVMHGVDHSRFHATTDAAGDAAVLASLGIRTPYLIHVGTIEPRKNIPNLIRAFDVVGLRDPELRLVLAGQLAWGEEELQQAITASRLSDRIVQLGYVADDCVAPLLRGAAAVAYPSIEEGFGLPALEALACGAPLVTSSGSVMSEFAGDAALCIDATNVDDLASALLELLEAGPRQDERRERGFARAREFTWDRSAAGHLDSYRLALGG